jgi:hypothetical protein
MSGRHVVLRKRAPNAPRETGLLLSQESKGL